MGSSLCCFSSHHEKSSLKGSGFYSDSTYESCEYDMKLRNKIAGTRSEVTDLPYRRDNVTQSTGVQSISVLHQTNTLTCKDYKVSTYASVQAFVGLTPIIEEPQRDAIPRGCRGRCHRPPRDSSCDSSISEKPTRATKFLSYGSMKHYQRFVKSN